MVYALRITTPHSNPLVPPRVAERPMPYRRRRRSRRPGAEAPTEQIERRVRSRDDGARWRRILALSARVAADLPDEVRTAWLELEESLHEHWFDVSIEHYHTGFEAGFGRASELLDLSSPLEPRNRLRLLAAVLVRIVAELEERERSPP